MKYRPQRSGFAESMAEVVDLPNRQALLNHLAGVGLLEGGSHSVNIRPYCYDDRTGWKTYIATVDGQAIGFTDGPCTENG